MVLPNFKENLEKCEIIGCEWNQRATWSHLGSFYRCGAT